MNEKTATKKTTAKKTTKKQYEIKGVANKIVATSRCAVKINDNYYTIEAMEERTMPLHNVSPSDINIDKEWEALFDSVNQVVDNQIEQIYDMMKK